MQRESTIPPLERPDTERINSDIEASGLVLCLSLSERESPLLFSPSHYYVHVHRYMYLPNIIPKCIEYFKSFIFPFYGNKCGVYFECISRNKDKGSSLPSPPNVSKVHMGDVQTDRVLGEKVILDWRLPIGVLFDTYCDVEYEDCCNYNDQKEDEISWRLCSKDELFYDHVNILEIRTNKTRDFSGEGAHGEGGADVNANVNVNADVNANVNADVNANVNADVNANVNADVNANVNVNEDVNANARDHALDVCSGINLTRFSSEVERTKNAERADRSPCDTLTTEPEHVMKNCAGEAGGQPQSQSQSQPHGKGGSKWYKLIMRDELNSEWYERQFLHISNKNIPWKLTVHFKGEEDDHVHFNSQGGNIQTGQTLQTGKVNLLPYSSSIPLYRGPTDFEEHMINQLKKANYIFHKNSRLLEMLPQQVEIELLHHLTHFNFKELCTLYRKYIDYNLIDFVDYFNGNFVEKVQAFYMHRKDGNRVNEGERKEERDEPVQGESFGTPLPGTPLPGTPLHGATPTDRSGIRGIVKDERVVRDVPIVVHIYGPPYNQVQTKFPLFKIICAEKNSHVTEHICMYTLGDFLHVQFPSFFRKVKSKSVKSLEKIDEGEDDVKVTSKKEESLSKEHVQKIMLQSERVFYFVEDDYLIFSRYMLIIINGIQIPLRTPLYWLVSNFNQFDNILHVILRIPAY
ncbi:autophagy protein 5, putative [Plasmodium ovale]|uniref:Autophagy protein 5 n=1 Tax=Plasmodium ovale TaxID=36330 RepID=A0A1D3TMD4_PLAOA|nr:autophagy protein 5, putative [Plasmodium ovale]